MESKAKLYQDALDIFNDCNTEVNQLESSIDLTERKLRELQAKKEKYDPGNMTSAADSLRKVIQQKTEEQELYAKQTADAMIDAYKEHTDRLEINYDRFATWFFKEGTAEKFCTRNSFRNVDPNSVKVESAPLVFRGISAEGSVGRKIVSIIAFGPGAIAYYLLGILLKNNIGIKWLADGLTFLGGIMVYFFFLGGMDDGFRNSNYSFLTKTPLIMLIAAFVLVLFERYKAKAALIKDGDKFLAIFEPDIYQTMLRVRIIKDFKEGPLRQMEKEAEELEKGVVGNDSKEVIEEHKRRYEEACRAYDSNTNTNNALHQKLDAAKKKHEEAASALLKMQEEIERPVMESNYNDCVLSDYFWFSDDEAQICGLVSHFKRPFVFMFEEDKSLIHDVYLKKAAKLVSLIYYGLVKENYHDIIDLRLIDLETGGSMISMHEETRKLFDGELLKVYKNSGDRESFYHELKQRKSLVLGQGGAGDIDLLNPERLKSGDVPLKYIIVLHFGKEAINLSSDILPLYRGAGKFGFIPIFIMTPEERDEIVKDKRSTIYTLISDCNSMKINW